MIKITNSAKETVKLGESIARKLSKGDCLSLCGDLGSGKTTFTKGICKGLGVKDASRVNSPTFVLAKEYEGKIPVFHIDLYRLEGLKDIEDIGIEEYLYGEGIAIVEWGEKLKSLLPKKCIFIKFKVVGKDKRKITIEDLRH